MDLFIKNIFEMFLAFFHLEYEKVLTIVPYSKDNLKCEKKIAAVFVTSAVCFLQGKELVPYDGMVTVRNLMNQGAS